MTLHVVGSLPVWIILGLLATRWLVVRTQSASVSWLMGCCCFVAVGLSINEASISNGIDRAVSVPNVADLIGRCLMVCGLFALAQSVNAATSSQQRTWRGHFVLCGLVLAALVALFFRIDASRPTDAFMEAYGSQLPTALYSGVEMAYIATVIGLAAAAMLNELQVGEGPGRVYWLFVYGAVGMVLLAAIAIAMNVAHVLGATLIVNALSTAYTPVFLVSMALLAVGAAGGAIADALREVDVWRAAKARTAELEPQLRELERAAHTEGVYFMVNYRPNEWRRRLHRLALEIEDRAREANKPVPGTARLEDIYAILEDSH